MAREQATIERPPEPRIREACEAFEKVLEALRPLTPEERSRVMGAVTVLLDGRRWE